MAKQRAGWYADPESPGRERRWDGTAWTEETRIPPPASPRRPRTVLKVMLGVVLGVLVLVAGCTALVGIGLNADQEDGITRAQFEGVALGTTRAAAESRLGAPQDAQDFQTKVPGFAASRSSCVYYQERGRSVLDGATFQLCFDEGRLTSKNAY